MFVRLRNYDKRFLLIIFSLIFIVFSSSLLFIYPCGEIVEFIGHADQANLANLAKNIALGKGAIVDNLWIHTNGGIPDISLPQAEPYWSLYPAYIIAIFFKIFGFSKSVFVLPAVIIRSLMIFIFIYLIRIQTKSWYPTLLIASILSYSPFPLNHYVNGLSDIYVAFFIFLSTIFLALAFIKPKSSILFCSISGILAGGSLGIKIVGIFSFSSLLIWIIAIFHRRNENEIKKIIFYLIGICTGLSGFLLYNIKNFGSVLPAGYKLVNEAARISFTLRKTGTHPNFAHNTAFFNPEISFEGLEKPLSLFNYYKDNFYEFISYLYDGRPLNLWWIPFSLIGIYLVSVKAKKSQFQNLNLLEWIVILSIPILFCGIILGFLTPYEARYWLFCVPFLLLSSIIAIHKLIKRPNLIYLSIAILSLPWQFVGVKNIIAKRCNPVSPSYQQITKLLPKNSTVMTANPWEFSFHTGYKSVMTPFTNNLNVVSEIAHKYEVEYLAIINNDARSKQYYEKLVNSQNKLFEYFYSDDDLRIYKKIK